MTDIEKEIRTILYEKKWSYTKSLYKSVNGKEHGYSLNKFRKLLELMLLDKSIKYKHDGHPHPYWYI